MIKNKKKIKKTLLLLLIFFGICFFAMKTSYAGQKAHAAENCRYGCYPSCPTGTSPISGVCNNGYTCCFDKATSPSADPASISPANGTTQNATGSIGSGTSGNFYVNQEKIPGAAQQTGDITQYIKDIVNFGFAVIGILTMFMLMIGAYQYLMAAGNIAKVDHAKTTISSALLGLIIGICAWVLLRTINPDLVNPSLQVIQGIGGSGSSVSGTAGTYNSVKTPTSCDSQQVQDAVKSASAQTGVDAKLLLAFAAKESNCNMAVRRTNGGTDCSIMQIRASAHCAGKTCDDLEKDPTAAVVCAANYIKTIQKARPDATTPSQIYMYYNGGENIYTKKGLTTTDARFAKYSEQYGDRVRLVEGYYKNADGKV